MSAIATAIMVGVTKFTMATNLAPTKVFVGQNEYEQLEVLAKEACVVLLSDKVNLHEDRRPTIAGMKIYLVNAESFLDFGA